MPELLCSIGGEQGEDIGKSLCYHCLGGALYYLGAEVHATSSPYKTDTIVMMLDFRDPQNKSVCFFKNRTLQGSINHVQDVKWFPAMSCADYDGKHLNSVRIDELQSFS